VNVFEPVEIPETVAVVPLPEVVALPGLRVKVQVPDEGKPLNTTLPVAAEQVGWVIVTTTGAEGTDKIVTVVVAVVTPHPPEAANV
jgi:hypothetical protein